jgi:hypothetical protein
MGYPLRWFKAGRLYETTSRTIHSRLLLVPSEELNTIVRGIIAGGKEGKSPLGARRIMNQHPHSEPSSTKRSPAPLVHAASPEVWITYNRNWLLYSIAVTDLEK